MIQLCACLHVVSPKRLVAFAERRLHVQLSQVADMQAQLASLAAEMKVTVSLGRVSHVSITH